MQPVGVLPVDQPYPPHPSTIPLPMVTIRPVRRALVPVNSDAAQRTSAPNYDEFQSDVEIWDMLQARPENVLRVKMPHCHVARKEDIYAEDAPQALDHAAEQWQWLRSSGLMQEAPGILWVYQIVSPKRPHAPQMGLGGYGRTAEIRTPTTPNGCIIRNEGIRQEKAEGRARLIRKIKAYIGTVNLAVRDDSGQLLKALEAAAAARPCDYEATDEAGNIHRVWLVKNPDEIAKFTALMAAEPAAYVADGNHRSAAAASLGYEEFLTVFFPTCRLGLEPYNRLLPLNGLSRDEFFTKLSQKFDIQPLGNVAPYRPAAVNTLGFYCGGQWSVATPKPGVFNANDAAESIDSDIVQRLIIDEILGMPDGRDKRINYVGGNKDAAYLKSRVDAGEYDLAISLAPVTMDQFCAVCEQNKFMPPKSTWFDPKIRSGLVMAILD
jgi:uncharacterized protein (DUF1015 family)